MCNKVQMPDEAGPDPSRGFAPIADGNAEILLLGTLPGRRSLSESRYYAHPRNAFWPIMQSLWGVSGDYRQRCAQLRRNRVALWDVLRESVRVGSLDADIQLDTARPNDFAEFLEQHRNIRIIGFNGKRAELLFRRYVQVAIDLEPVTLVGLPSTSPAFAGMPVREKCALWRQRLVETGAS